MDKKVRIGFLGSGGIARAHAYALDALKYYYADVPQIERVVVASPTPAHRETFANRFGFAETSSPEELLQRDDLDAVYILGPNPTHTPQLLKAIGNPAVKRIYIEKPVAISREEVQQLQVVVDQENDKFILMGFQFLQKSPIRKALAHWRSGGFWDPGPFQNGIPPQRLSGSKISSGTSRPTGSRPTERCSRRLGLPRP